MNENAISVDSPQASHFARTANREQRVAGGAARPSARAQRLRRLAALALALAGCGGFAPVDCFGCQAPFQCVYDRNEAGTYFCGFPCTAWADPRCPGGCRSCDGARCSLGDGTAFGVVCDARYVRR